MSLHPKIETRYPSGQAETIVWTHAYAAAYTQKFAGTPFVHLHQAAANEADKAVELFRERSHHGE